MIRKATIILAGLLFAFAAVAAVLYVGNATPVVPPIPATEAANPTKPFVVKLHAQWCVVCATTTGIWKQIEQAYATRANLVVFDFTNDETIRSSRAEAERLGLEKFFDEAGSTGSVVVLHPRTKEVAAWIDGDRDFEAYRSAIEAASLSDGR